MTTTVSDRALNKLDHIAAPLASEMANPQWASRILGEGLTFDDVSESWGFTDKTFSNGSAYADLDNDGDLDLVVNNVNMPPLIYIVSLQLTEMIHESAYQKN